MINPWNLMFRSTTIVVGLIVCTVALGGMMAWASLAPLAEGVVVFGKVSIERDRKTVQHLEGGIIQSILVSEGERVEDGQELLILADVSVAAGRDQVALELSNAIATVDRLTSLYEGAQKVNFRPLKELAIDEIERNDIWAKQTELFAQQHATLEADISVLDTRKTGLEERSRNLASQIKTNKNAEALMREELTRKKALLSEGLIRINAVDTLKRQLIDLEANLIRIKTDKNESESQALELAQQISQRQSQFKEDISDKLVEATAMERSIREKLISAQDTVNRTIVRAPQAGQILNLAHTTVGGVIIPGEDILEIIPTVDGLVAQVEVMPIDRDSVNVEQRVELRLSGTNTWRSPLLTGAIEQISADLKMSPNGSYSYYEATILVDFESSEKLDVNALPGMPVEAFIFSGRSRTFLDYVLEPISTTIRRGARE